MAVAVSRRKREHQQHQQQGMPLSYATTHGGTTVEFSNDDSGEFVCCDGDLEYRANCSPTPPPPTTKDFWSDSSPTRSTTSSISGASGDLSPMWRMGESMHSHHHCCESMSGQELPHLASTTATHRSSSSDSRRRPKSPNIPPRQPLNEIRTSSGSSSRSSSSHGDSSCRNSSPDYFSSSRSSHLSSTSSSTGISISPFWIALSLIGLVAISLSTSAVGYAVQEASELKANRELLTRKLIKTEQDLMSLKKEMMAMDAVMIHEHKVENDGYHSDDPNQDLVVQSQALAELNKVQSRMQELSVNDKALKSRVQAISRDAVESKYGPGPYYVEMELIFPVSLLSSDANGRHLKQHEAGKPTKFVVEMAPLSEMPHSVHTFLEMVSAGLIDGCSFILNALHVLKAAPLPYDGSLAATKAKAFSDHGLEGVAFKEYSDNFPHRQYTMGFAADGSPSFYINTDDNADVHVGDPCFGRIITGVDTIQRLEAAPTRNGIWFEQKIGIKRAHILSASEYNSIYNSGNRQGLRQQ